MTRYQITFEVETNADQSDVLAALDERVGQLLDDGYGTEIYVDTDTISVNHLGEAEKANVSK